MSDDTTTAETEAAYIEGLARLLVQLSAASARYVELSHKGRFEADLTEDELSEAVALQENLADVTDFLIRLAVTVADGAPDATEAVALAVAYAQEVGL